MTVRPRTLLSMAKQVEDDLKDMLMTARKLRRTLEQIQSRVEKPRTHN
jgi:hypothetical protein